MIKAGCLPGSASYQVMCKDGSPKETFFLHFFHIKVSVGHVFCYLSKLKISMLDYLISWLKGIPAELIYFPKIYIHCWCNCISNTITPTMNIYLWKIVFFCQTTENPAVKYMMTSSKGYSFRVTGPLCGNSWVNGEFQWRGALMFSLISAWTNGWVNNRDAYDLRRHRAHFDVIVMIRCNPKRTPWYRVIFYTVKSVYNDHLTGYFSAFWSSSRWPRAT